MNNIKKFSFILISLLILFLTVSCKDSEQTKTFNVNLKYEDGAIYKTENVNEGSSITLDSLTKEGYTFLGWYLNDTKQESPFVPTNNVDLVAKFAINQYTYKFVDADGTVLKEETADYGSTIVYPANPSKEGNDEFVYEFSGWDKNDTVLKEDITFTALYLETKNQYTYQFIVNGVVVKEETLAYGSTITYPENPKNTETQEFVGWDNNATILKKDEVFNAKFSDITKNYTYKFVDADGTLIKEETLAYGSTITYPANPSKEGNAEFSYKFVGWDKNDTVLKEDIIFTALYLETKNQYTYKFVDFDGKVLKEATVDYGSTIVYPSNPVREESSVFRYEFTGWDNDDKVITQDVVFKAQYKEIEKEQDTPVDPDKPHVHTEVVLPAKKATCKETGLTEGKKCSSCGEILVAQTEIAKVAHTEEILPAKEAKCEEAGLTEGKKCSVCGEVIVAQKEVAKLGHKYVDGKCSVCNADDPNYQPETNLDSLEGLKLSIMGDSISTFYAEGSVMNSYYGGENQFFYPRYSTTIKTVDKTWWYQLITNNKMELGINNSWSGSMAYGSSSSSGQSDGRVNTIDDNGMPDVVLIFLGTNDCGSAISVANYRSAITTIINKIRKLGDPEILITALGYSDYNSNNYKSRRLEYNAEIRKIASEYGCGVVPLDQYIVETSYMFYLEDSLHYNAKGATLLSKIYEKSIKEYLGIPYTGTIEVEHQEPLPEGAIGKITATANSGFWTGYASNVYFTTASSAANAIYSTTYEITKNTTNNKYYVTEINKSGASQGFNCDYVLMISDANTDKTALLQLLKNVKVGSIVEFNENGSLPMDIIFKEGDGSAPSEPSTPVTPPVDKVEGELNIGAFNDGVWTKYADTVMAYEQAKLGQGSKYINFYIIGLTKSSGSDYEITCLKPLNDSTFAFPKCDYYILIYMDLEEKSYYENAQVGDIVTINGDITSGVCSIAFK